MAEELFEAAKQEQPLAARMRPRSLDEFVGQEHILGPGRLLRRAIQADQLSSLIFYGPPGTGKTTLARVIANTTRSLFLTINAVLAGVREIRQAVEEAQDHRRRYGRRTILFVDEVHRWNKAQQDALLPWVENGAIVLVGATTENPYFEVIPALVSRSRIFQLHPLTAEDLLAIARRCLEDPERGYGGLKVRIDEEALTHLVDVSQGDARTLLNALELAVETSPKPVHISLEVAEESIQRRVVLYDKEGDYHFDTVSAFIKSLRGSDPDAALYWMAKMIAAGEDPRFIFRRMLIFAAEDVGLADPQALVTVEAAARAFDRVGMPEGRFHLSQAALYLATATKSNSTMAFFDALKAVEEERDGEVPDPLKDASRDRRGLGHGEGYLYPHAFRDHWVAQQYLPDRLQGRIFYRPGSLGYEASLAEPVQRRREAQLAAVFEAQRFAGGSPELQSGERPEEAWQLRATGRRPEELGEIRDRIFTLAVPSPDARILDLAAGSGLLVWEALRRVPQGVVGGRVDDEEEAGRLYQEAEAFNGGDRLKLRAGPLQELSRLFGGPEGIRFDVVLGFNTLLREKDRSMILSQAAAVLRKEGKLILAETLPAQGTRLSSLVSPPEGSRKLFERYRSAEAALFTESGGDPLALSLEGLQEMIREAGFAVVSADFLQFSSPRRIRGRDLERWFSPGEGKERATYARRLAAFLEAAELEEIRDLFLGALADQEVAWSHRVAFVLAELGGSGG